MTELDHSRDQLNEDVADIRADLLRVGAEITEQRAMIDELAAHSYPADSDGDLGPATDDAEFAFILTMTDERYRTELDALQRWVGDLLVPVYLREVTPNAPWCPRWWEHDEAVARLHALWLAWQQLVLSPQAELVSPAIWNRDHLDPVLFALRAPDGPFVACMTHPDRPNHRPQRPPFARPDGTGSHRLLMSASSATRTRYAAGGMP